MKYKILPVKKVDVEVTIPADKSISHRALIISSLAKGKTEVVNFLNSDDTIATFKCLRRLKIEITKRKGSLVVQGKGKYFPLQDAVRLYAGDSGTTMRILSGVLAAQKFPTLFNGGSGLKKRPMKRMITPLRLMGADISGRKIGSDEYPPLKIRPVERLKPISYTLPVASAQVKSALLLAALFVKEQSVIKEPYYSRDHTERMLEVFGAKIKKIGKKVIIRGERDLISPGVLFIPGDFSSASFFIALGLIMKESHIVIKGVNLNPTRCGLLKVLKRMGAKIRIVNRKRYFEPYGDLYVESSNLKGVCVYEDQIPLLIDEVPILSVICSFARGKSVILGLRELKVKESDRLEAIRYNLSRAGVYVDVRKYNNNSGEEDYCLIIKGRDRKHLMPSYFRSFSDHRIAMSMIILSLGMGKVCWIDDIECINKSFPDFIDIIENIEK